MWVNDAFWHGPCLLSLHATDVRTSRYSHGISHKRRRGGVTNRRYVQIRYPWAASYEAGRSAPRAYLASLIQQTLRYGMPARRYGRAGSWVIRHAASGGALKTALRPWRRTDRPDVDSILEQVAGSWERFAEGCPRLPRERPARLSALALKRRAADTVFVFGDGQQPLLVCKAPRGEEDSLELEATALSEAKSAKVAPLPLGKLGAIFVQEALPGAPLEVEPISPASARTLPWRPEHEELAEGLIRLARATARPGPPQELRSELLSALQAASLNEEVRRRARVALEDLENFDLAVLRHGDTSPQNCLFDRGRFTGLVDWEIARPRGAPGFDILNAAVAYVDQGVGLVRWSEERAVESFRAAWQFSPFFRHAREAARSATRAAGGSDDDHERLEIAFFARRLASRAASPSSYATGPCSAALMLEIACAR